MGYEYLDPASQPASFLWLLACNMFALRNVYRHESSYTMAPFQFILPSPEFNSEEEDVYAMSELMWPFPANAIVDAEIHLVQNRVIT